MSTYFKKVGWMALFIPSLSVAQVDTLFADTTVTDTLEKPLPSHYMGAYLLGVLSWEPSVPNQNIVSQLGIGIQYDRWILECAVHDFLGSYRTFVIFPNIFQLGYRYASIGAGYTVVSNRTFNISGHFLLGRGDILWKYEEDGRALVRDEFDLLKGYVRCELNSIRYLKPFVAVGYQQANGLKLTMVNASSMNGVNLQIGVRVGYFNQ